MWVASRHKASPSLPTAVPRSDKATAHEVGREQLIRGHSRPRVRLHCSSAWAHEAATHPLVGVETANEPVALVSARTHADPLAHEALCHGTSEGGVGVVGAVFVGHGFATLRNPL